MSAMATKPARRSPAPAVRRPARRRRAQRARHTLYRELILEAAEQSFAVRGIEGSRMEMIAEAAGLSLGTVYSVFRGKTEIVDALHEARLRAILALSDEAARGLSEPLELLAAGVRAYVRYFVEHPDYLRMYVAEGTSWGVLSALAAHPLRQRAWSEGVAQLARVFERGMAQGVFLPGDPAQVARMMIAMQQVQLTDWLEGGMREPAEQLCAEIEQRVRRWFSSDRVRARGKR